MKAIFKTFLLNLVTIGLVFSPAKYQTEEDLVLSLSRDFGYSSGTGSILGTFSMKVNGPDDLARVVFLIDGVQVGEDSDPPFRFQFKTSDYALGAHTLKAIGFTTSGSELQSHEQRREFVSAEEGWKAAGRIAIPIIIFSLGAVLLSAFLPAILGRKKKGSLPLGSARNYGVLGGTICPKCDRPFGIHLFGLNLAVGRLDRCPHCGRWSLVRRYPIHELRAAEERELKSEHPQEDISALTEDEKLVKELEKTRYQDF